jgi:hypothetical protein
MNERGNGAKRAFKNRVDYRIVVEGGGDCV